MDSDDYYAGDRRPVWWVTIQNKETQDVEEFLIQADTAALAAEAAPYANAQYERRHEDTEGAGNPEAFKEAEVVEVRKTKIAYIYRAPVLEQPKPEAEPVG